MDACEVSGSLQIGVRGPIATESSVRLLHQPFAVLGRDHRSDVPLDHGLVSRRHLYIQVVRGHAFWIDLDSRSGTVCQGEIRRSGWLDARVRIYVGPFEVERLGDCKEVSELESQTSAPWPSPFVARRFDDQPLPEVALEFLNGPSRFAQWPMNRVMSLIGSSRGCKFRLADPSVSSFHCSLLRTHLGLWVVDLLGSSGIVVNDASIRYAQLNDNDVLGVGRYRIRIRCRFAPRVANDRGSRRSCQASLVMPQLASASTQNNDVTTLNPNISGPSSLPIRPLQVTLQELMSSLQAPKQNLSVQWLSTGNNELDGIERPELSETLLIPLMNQFGHMQQQMLDQFQGAIATLVQMFGSLHRDQMQTIREELNHIRDLTKELQALKAELAERTVARSEAVSADLGIAVAPVEDSVTAPQVNPHIDPKSSSSLSHANVKSSENSYDASPNTESRVLASSKDTHDILQRARSETANPRTAASAQQVNLGSDRDVVVWLHQRMVTLQQERETRWQRILKFLPGLA